MKTIPLPTLYSLPLQSTHTVLASSRETLADRTKLLADIDSGALASIEFDARVYRHGPNRNHFTFRPQDLPTLAPSFASKPFLRDHNTREIAARDGLILSSQLVGAEFHQRIRLTTRRGMTDYVEGRIDRFSIGWDFEWVLCTVCNSDWLSCDHFPGHKYRTPQGEVTCELCFMSPVGKETSAVNANAVDGTGLLAALQTYKGQYKKGGSFMPAQPATPAPPVLDEVAPSESVLPPADLAPQPGDSAPLPDDRQQVAAALLGAQDQVTQLNQNVQASTIALLTISKNLLNTALAGSKLPGPAQAQVRKRFQAQLDAGQPIDPLDLDKEIADTRAMLGEVMAGAMIQGPGRVNSMFNTDDSILAAVADLFRVERDERVRSAKPARLSGIRELYHMLTGDFNFHGGYFPDEIGLATTLDFTGLVKNALNKLVVKGWDEMGIEGYGWWEQIALTEPFNSLQQITGVLIGTIGSLPVVQERGEYQELRAGDSPETGDWTKYGGYFPLTLEMIDRDETRKVVAYGQELGKAARRNISEQVASIFTSNSGAGPAMADGGALFNASVATAVGGHANLLTTALGSDYTAWKAVSTAMYKQAMFTHKDTPGTGKRQAIRPKYCLVPVDLYDAACDLFVSRQTYQTLPANYYGQVIPLAVPEWTDATDWAAVANPKVAPAIFVGHRFGLKPEIYVAGEQTSPAVFSNDEHRIKIRHFLAIWVNDFRPLHKSNVA